MPPDVAPLLAFEVSALVPPSPFVPPDTAAPPDADELPVVDLPPLAWVLVPDSALLPPDAEFPPVEERPPEALVDSVFVPPLVALEVAEVEVPPSAALVVDVVWPPEAGVLIDAVPPEPLEDVQVMVPPVAAPPAVELVPFSGSTPFELLVHPKHTKPASKTQFMSIGRLIIYYPPPGNHTELSDEVASRVPIGIQAHARAGAEKSSISLDARL